MNGLKLVKKAAFWLLLAFIAVYTLFPFYWAIVSSLKTGSELFEVDPWPKVPAWSNYAAVFEGQPFGQNIFNSVIVATSVVVLSLALRLTASFALARIE